MPQIFATKEEALASIRKCEAVRQIEAAFGPAGQYAGPVIWIVESVGAAESAELLSSVRKEDEDARPHFAR